MLDFPGTESTLCFISRLHLILIFLCFKLIIVNFHTQRANRSGLKIQKIKSNHNLYNNIKRLFYKLCFNFSLYIKVILRIFWANCIFLCWI